MAYCQMSKSTEVKCVDNNNAFKQPHGGKYTNNTMMTCQTTCHGTTTGSQTNYGSGNPHTHKPNNGGCGGATQVHGYKGGAAYGGYNGGAGQVHGCNSHGAGQVHGYNGAAGMACVGKQHGNGFRRKHSKAANDSCSSGSDSDSDDDCRRRC